MLPVGLTLTLILAPLLGSLMAGFGGRLMSLKMAHRVTILGVGTAFSLSSYLAYQMFCRGMVPYHFNSYSWHVGLDYSFNVGFWIDQLTVILMQVVSFISLLVHIYSIAYMGDDPGYRRYFSYLSLFTFAMLVLVSANNMLQLYFGWEGVGVVSYLLIGFWFKREEATVASLKAFIVNRIGDFGFMLGIALLFNYCGSLDYATLWQALPTLSQATIDLLPGYHCSVVTLIDLLLLIGAMGKSAQMPLHIWLPDSMAGPTPVSALIHAATMVTAGIYLIARLSPLYEHSTLALNTILVIGASTALFTGLVAIVQNDVKKIIAYSTLSQLGYMMVGLGSSAYAASIFHLITHAFFKALLFLAAGSVILALHHEQDIRKMGQLWRRLPITYVTFFIAALALAAIPPFSGFYSKEAIIEAVHLSPLSAASYAYVCVLLGAFVTALYIFRAFFLIFHTNERLTPATRAHVAQRHLFDWPIDTVLILLAVPAAVIGILGVGAVLYAGLLGHSVVQLNLPFEYSAPWLLAVKSLSSLPSGLALAGIGVAWLCYGRWPNLPTWFSQRFAFCYSLLLRKYGFDEMNQRVFVAGGQQLAQLSDQVDNQAIDKNLVYRPTQLISWLATQLRKLQSGCLYHYTLIMITGVIVLIICILIGAT